MEVIMYVQASKFTDTKIEPFENKNCFKRLYLRNGRILKVNHT